jgi:hypothetical protein
MVNYYTPHLAGKGASKFTFGLKFVKNAFLHFVFKKLSPCKHNVRYYISFWQQVPRIQGSYMKWIFSKWLPNGRYSEKMFAFFYNSCSWWKISVHISKYIQNAKHFHHAFGQIFKKIKLKQYFQQSSRTAQWATCCLWAICCTYIP